MADQRITRVNFTYALPEGMWVEYQDGGRQWVAFTQLVRELGDQAVAKLRNIANHNGMTVMWYSVANGRNVFENGMEVN